MQKLCGPHIGNGHLGAAMHFNVTGIFFDQFHDRWRGDNCRIHAGIFQRLHIFLQANEIFCMRNYIHGNMHSGMMGMGKITCCLDICHRKVGSS